MRHVTYCRIHTLYICYAFYDTSFDSRLQSLFRKLSAAFFFAVATRALPASQKVEKGKELKPEYAEVRSRRVEKRKREREGPKNTPSLFSLSRVYYMRTCSCLQSFCGATLLGAIAKASRQEEWLIRLRDLRRERDQIAK